MAKATKEKKPKSTVVIPPIDHTPLNEVVAELAAGIQGGTDVAARQATHDKLKAYAALVDPKEDLVV